MRPLQPSSFHILARAGPTPVYETLPGPCTWKMIFNRSSGLTTVLLTAPATPPAMKDAVSGCLR